MLHTSLYTSLYVAGFNIIRFYKPFSAQDINDAIRKALS
jgi:hypothetical protein